MNPCNAAKDQNVSALSRDVDRCLFSALSQQRTLIVTTSIAGCGRFAAGMNNRWRPRLGRLRLLSRWTCSCVRSWSLEGMTASNAESTLTPKNGLNLWPRDHHAAGLTAGKTCQPFGFQNAIWLFLSELQANCADQTCGLEGHIELSIELIKRA